MSGIPTAKAADKLRVSNCYIGGAILPLWMAKDAGFYQREGLDVEQVWIQRNPAVSSLISGEIDLLYCIPHNVIGAMASGADLQFIASVYNRMQYRIVAAPGIDRVEQLKGKVVGIARIHDVSHFYLRLALKKLGMNADQDVRFLSTGGQADRTLALKNGRVQASILNPAYALTLEKDGFKTILDLEKICDLAENPRDLGILYAASGCVPSTSGCACSALRCRSRASAGDTALHE